MSPSIFTCPVCRASLSRQEKQYICPAGHAYDIAASGHVNLLLANRKHSPNPGDDKAMIRARADFLNKGYFRILADELSRLALLHASSGGVVVDSGCGEGYYTGEVAEAFKQAGKPVRLAGIDIAKPGVQAAAKKFRSVEFAVASAYELPLADGSVDVLWSCFAPVDLAGFHRVLVPGGRLVVVQPTARHLWGFKSVLYDEPYENPPNFYEHPNLININRYEKTGAIHIAAGADLLNLFRMTPYYWKTSVSDGEKLKHSGPVDTEIGFIIDILGKQ